MQKGYNILSAIAIVGLGFWVYWLYRTRIPNPALTRTSAPATPPVVQQTPEKTSVSGAELWDAVQSKVKDMKIDLTFQ